MFGRGSFNRLRFNPPEISDDYNFRDVITASVEVGGNLGENIPFSGNSAEVFHGRGKVSFAVSAVIIGAEALQSHVFLSLAYCLNDTYNAIVHEKTETKSNLVISGQYTTILHNDSRTESDIYITETAREDLRGSNTVGADYNAPIMEGFGIMEAQAGTAQYETDYINIAVTIPAGGVLIIDTENYTVMLNDENVLYAHSGEWLEIDRNTEQIDVIFPAVRKATAALTYRERYL